MTVHIRISVNCEEIELGTLQLTPQWFYKTQQLKHMWAVTKLVLL